MPKKVFTEKNIMFTGKMDLDAWSVALHAAETWTLTQADKR